MAKKAAKKSAKKRGRTVAREVEHGRIVSPKFALSNPSTTVIETMGQVFWTGWIDFLHDDMVCDRPGRPRLYERKPSNTAVAIKIIGR